MFDFLPFRSFEYLKSLTKATTKAKNSLTSKQTKTTKSVPTSDATSTYLSPTSTEYVLTKDGFDLQFTLGMNIFIYVNSHVFKYIYLFYFSVLF